MKTLACSKARLMSHLLYRQVGISTVAQEEASFTHTVFIHQLGKVLPEAFAQHNSQVAIVGLQFAD